MSSGCRVLSRRNFDPSLNNFKLFEDKNTFEYWLPPPLLPPFTSFPYVYLLPDPRGGRRRVHHRPPDPRPVSEELIIFGNSRVIRRLLSGNFLMSCLLVGELHVSGHKYFKYNLTLLE